MATYYVDFTGGNDSKDGLAQTISGGAGPWKTIAKVNSSSFSAGDSILFKCGEIWRETLTIPSSGSAGANNTILFGSYGVGAPPILTGSDLLTGWTLDAVLGGENFIDASGAKPEAWWMLEEATGATRVDGSGNGNDLTDVNSVTQQADPKQGTYSAGYAIASSQYLTRAGADLSANYPMKVNPTNNFTVGGWIKFSTYTDLQTFYAWGYPTSGAALQIRMEFLTPLYKITALVYNGSSSPKIVTDSAVLVNTWYHVVVRWDSTSQEFCMFLDGVKQASTQTITGVLESSLGNFHLGAGITAGADPTRFANCYLDEFFAFNAKLTDAQIVDILNYGLTGGSGFNTYYATLAADPVQVLVDDARLVRVASQAEMTTPGTFYYSLGDTRLYIRTAADTDPTTAVVEVPGRTLAVDVLAKSYVIIDSLNAQKASSNGGRVRNSDHVTITNCLFTLNYNDGLATGADSGAEDVLLITGNTANFNGASGLDVYQIKNSTVSHNLCHGNGMLAEGGNAVQADSAGIRTGSTVTIDNIFEHNTVYDNGYNNGEVVQPSGHRVGGGIWLDTTGPGNIVRFNRVYHNAIEGLLNEWCTGNTWAYNIAYGHVANVGYSIGLAIARASHDCLIYNNVCYGNVGGLASTSDKGITGTYTGNIFKNNISVGNSVVQFLATGGGENEGTWGSGNVYENNCFGAEAANFIEWVGDYLDVRNGTYKSTYAAFETSYGGDSNSVEADPLMTDPDNADFTLQAGSPCINAGVDVGFTWDIRGFPIVGLPDVGAFEFSIPTASPVMF